LQQQDRANQERTIMEQAVRRTSPA
jgi:hypothetical protein